MPDYNVLGGLNYGPTDKRVVAGEVVSDLPPESVAWLVEQGHIELVEAVEAVETPDETPDRTLAPADLVFDHTDDLELS